VKIEVEKPETIISKPVVSDEEELEDKEELEDEEECSSNGEQLQSGWLKPMTTMIALCVSASVVHSQMLQTNPMIFHG